MNKKIIIQIPFNVFGFNIKNEMNEEWIKQRLQIFVEYSLKSLKAQTNQYFTTLFRCRDSTIPLITKEIGKKIPNNVLIVGIEECEIQIKKLSEDYNYLYFVRMDSDDLYINTFIDMLQNYNPKPETEVLINQNCYEYEIYQKRLAYFFYNSPQSYVLIYKTKEYIEGKKYYMKRGHSDAILLKHELLLGNNYLNTIHNKNNESIFKGDKGKKNWEEIKDKENAMRILREFGLFEEKKR